MRLDASQQMHLEQRMVLAPRMIQSMEILQLPLLALQERIEQEMLSNPVLEQEEPELTESPGTAENPESPETAPAPERELPDGEQTLVVQDDDSRRKDFERLDRVTDDFDDYLARGAYARPRRAPDDRDAKLDAMQNTAAPAQSLNEFLLDQWAFVEADPLVKKAGAVIIDFIDEAGYLASPLQSLPERLPAAAPHHFERALRLIQTLEPAGVGARDLPECLLIQLRNSPEDRSLEIELVSHHLKDIEMNRFPAVARKAGRTLPEIQHALKVISRLDPRPGLQIGSRETPSILPDVIVEYDEQSDAYTARLHDAGAPNLRVSATYLDMARRGKIPPEARDFLKNNIRSARWIIEAIEQRKHTLLRVVNHVLKSQRDFFEFGPLHLKPLPMVEVAQALGIHVGTVSRAVSGKYMQTPLGIYPLRFFFSGGTENAAGESLSWDAVKAKLQEIIDHEDKQNPYNDDDLVRELAQHGLTVARRTIAKYRALLHVPPARRRRRYQ